MTKSKVTKKAIKGRFSTIYNVGYCNIQNLLALESADAYSTRAEGWACDYYMLAGGAVICTGYSCIGQKVDHETLKKWEHEAKYIVGKGLPHQEEEQEIITLLYAFLEELEK